jgi:hypothetical protein
MDISDVAFKEKAAGGRVYVCGFHADRVYIAACVNFQSRLLMTPMRRVTQ